MPPSREVRWRGEARRRGGGERAVSAGGWSEEPVPSGEGHAEAGGRGRRRGKRRVGGEERDREARRVTRAAAFGFACGHVLCARGVLCDLRDHVSVLT